MSDIEKIGRTATERISNNKIDEARVGDWYWVMTQDGWGIEESPTGEGYDPEKAERGLWCVSELGSNYIKFSRTSSEGRYTSDFRLHNNNFASRCEREDNWREVLKDRLEEIQTSMQEAMQKMLEEGKKLCLVQGEAHEPEEEDSKSLLPVVATDSPVKYKNDLISFRDDRMPALKKDIEALSKDFARESKNLALPDMVKLELLTSGLSIVNDRIFTVELYCGLQETVVQIAEGLPASIETPIAVRQQMLYMDEETLFDYTSGGMDYSKISKFDEWVVQPKNLDRILPEKKGIVAFRVRRGKKDYGRILSIADAFSQMAKNEANMETYLLIRNGETVYRIISTVDFSPRLVPFREEIGTDQFQERQWSSSDEIKKIGPDNVKYDDCVKDQERLLTHYNRMVILIQGLLDRSRVFMPHPAIKLTSDDHMDKWVKCIRDEEDGLPAHGDMTWESYCAEKNATIKKGDIVYSTWFPDDYGRYYGSGSGRDYTRKESQVVHRNNLCEVASVKRDKSAVRIRWQPMDEVYDRSYYGYDSHVDERWRYLWVPMDKVFHLSAYELGDYKKFLCDHALKGKYLKWAGPLMTAEDFMRLKAGEVPEDASDSWIYQAEKFFEFIPNLEAKIAAIREKNDEAKRKAREAAKNS